MNTPDRVFGRKIVPEPERRRVERLTDFKPDLMTRVRAMITRKYSYNYLLPKFEQGQFGSCVANAASEEQEGYLLKRTKSRPTLSRRAIYAQAKYSYEPDDVLDDGLQVADGLNVAQNFGAVLESDWPYPANSDTTSMFVPVPANLWHPEYKIKGFQAVKNDPQSIIYALLKKGFLIAANEYPDAWSYPNADGRLSPTTVPSGNGHCWVLPGFDLDFVNLDNTTGMFELHNSWGDWGKNGTGFIPFSAYGRTGWPDELYSVVM